MEESSQGGVEESSQEVERVVKKWTRARVVKKWTRVVKKE